MVTVDQQVDGNSWTRSRW